MTTGWEKIEAVSGLSDVRDFARREIQPRFEPFSAPQKSVFPTKLTFIFGPAFVGFIVLHTLVDAVLPDTRWGNFLSFISFPLLFVFSLVTIFFVFRRPIGELIQAAQARYIARAQVWSLIATRAGVVYASAPGGAPMPLKWLVRQSWAPKELRAIAQVLDAHGGMDGAVNIVRASGIMLANTLIGGSDADRPRYIEQANQSLSIEDGFSGVRGGVNFDAFEWIEKINDAEDVHHLAIVFAAPVRLHGVTQMRTKNGAWGQVVSGESLSDVDLGARAFTDAIRLRSSDQTEARALFNPAVMERTLALAHGQKVRAVAQGGHIVFDFSGANRFNMLDLNTGVWSAETVRQSLEEFADMLGLVDALAHAFMLRRKGPDA